MLSAGKKVSVTMGGITGRVPESAMGAAAEAFTKAPIVGGKTAENILSSLNYQNLNKEMKGSISNFKDLNKVVSDITKTFKGLKTEGGGGAGGSSRDVTTAGGGGFGWGGGFKFAGAQWAFDKIIQAARASVQTLIGKISASGQEADIRMLAEGGLNYSIRGRHTILGNKINRWNDPMSAFQQSFNRFGMTNDQENRERTAILAGAGFRSGASRPSVFYAASMMAAGQAAGWGAEETAGMFGQMRMRGENDPKSIQRVMSLFNIAKIGGGDQSNLYLKAIKDLMNKQLETADKNLDRTTEMANFFKEKGMSPAMMQQATQSAMSVGSAPSGYQDLGDYALKRDIAMAAKQIGAPSDIGSVNTAAHFITNMSQEAFEQSVRSGTISPEAASTVRAYVKSKGGWNQAANALQQLNLTGGGKYRPDYYQALTGKMPTPAAMGEGYAGALGARPLSPELTDTQAAARRIMMENLQMRFGEGAGPQAGTNLLFRAWSETKQSLSEFGLSITDADMRTIEDGILKGTLKTPQDINNKIELLQQKPSVKPGAARGFEKTMPSTQKAAEFLNLLSKNQFGREMYVSAGVKGGAHATGLKLDMANKESVTRDWPSAISNMSILENEAKKRGVDLEFLKRAHGSAPHMDIKVKSDEQSINKAIEQLSNEMKALSNATRQGTDATKQNTQATSMSVEVTRRPRAIGPRMMNN